MGYFTCKIKQLIRWAHDNDWKSCEASYPSNKLASSTSIDHHSGGMNFTVYQATGGKVIQVRTYDSRTDISRSTLYVVTDKEDLGHELGQIITVESLSR